MFLFGLVFGAEFLPLPDFIRESSCILYVGSINKSSICSNSLSKLLATKKSLDHSQEPNAWTLDIQPSCVPSERHIQADARTVRLERFMPAPPTFVLFELFPTISHEGLLLMPDAIRNIGSQMAAGSSLIIDTIPYFSTELNPEFYKQNPFHGFFSPHAVVWAWHSLIEHILEKENKEWDIDRMIADQGCSIDDATRELTIHQYKALCIALPLCTAEHSETRTTIETLQSYSSLIKLMVNPEMFAKIINAAPRLSCIFYDLVWLTRKKDMKDFLCDVGFKDVTFERGSSFLTGRYLSWIIKATKKV